MKMDPRVREDDGIKRLRLVLALCAFCAFSWLTQSAPAPSSWAHGCAPPPKVASEQRKIAFFVARSRAVTRSPVPRLRHGTIRTSKQYFCRPDNRSMRGGDNGHAARCAHGAIRSSDSARCVLERPRQLGRSTSPATTSTDVACSRCVLDRRHGYRSHRLRFGVTEQRERRSRDRGRWTFHVRKHCSIRHCL